MLGDATRVREGSTILVVGDGDGSVRLMGVLAAEQEGAGANHRHEPPKDTAGWRSPAAATRGKNNLRRNNQAIDREQEVQAWPVYLPIMPQQHAEACGGEDAASQRYQRR